MITKTDLEISKESYTKKDFYQIYPESIETFQALTKRWDPEQTNESDPGVVLLKRQAFDVDRLNYNLDKNILEHFLPSATQEDSVRKLCEQRGYDMSYYQSATTSVTFMWTGDKLSSTDPTKASVTLPRFETVLTNDAEDISYILTKNLELNIAFQEKTVPVMEGELVQFEINSDNIVLLSNLDEDNRLYLPESKIAENGIWVLDAITGKDWEKVDNLNTIQVSKKAWKFGYDSYRAMPYIQFPDTVANLMVNGLKIFYVRTSGLNGNINAKVLTKLVNSQITITYENETTETVDSNDYLILQNPNSTTNGRDIETIDEAYVNSKKIIGTFDTLTTCLDYSNAIYNMVADEVTDNTPLVSNCQVSDIRDDLNFSNTVVEYGKFGLSYINTADSTLVEVPVYTAQGNPDGTAYIYEPKITNYDLYLYPLNPIKNSYTQTTYQESFKPLNPLSNNNYYEICNQLEDYKTISHNLLQVDVNEANTSDLYLIKNYYSLAAKILTNYKVNDYEAIQIKQNIYDALYRNFNARQLDYGEEIPYDRLLEVIQNADTRIKMVLLEEPTLRTAVMNAYGEEDDLTVNSTEYKKLLAKNILGGRIPLFDYLTDIQIDFNETNTGTTDDVVYGTENKYAVIQNPAAAAAAECSVTYVSTNLEIPTTEQYKITKNESVQLIAKKLISTVSYPMYVNYWFTTNGTGTQIDVPYKLVEGDALYINYTDTDNTVYWIKYYGTTVEYYRNGTVYKTEEFSGIIQTNFRMQTPEGTPTKRAEDIDSWGFPSADCNKLYALTTAQQIDIKDYSLAEIKKNSYCYWIANNNNTITLTWDSVNEEYYYILEEGEYFFYTDDAKTKLVTFGSGTLLRYQTHTKILDQNIITWTLNNETSVTSDSIAQNGIGAFANSDWVRKDFSTYHLITQQMETRNLIEGDKIISLSLIADVQPSSIDSSTWSKLQSLTYMSDSGMTTIETDSQNIQNWFIKPKLNLNLSSTSNQTLKDNESITLYTSYYTNLSGDIITSQETILKALTSNPKSIIEKICTSQSVHKYAPSSGNKLSLRSNFPVQRAGGTFVPVHSIDYTGTLKDNLTIYAFKVKPATKIDTSAVETSVDVTETIGLKAIASLKLPIYIPSGNKALVSIYISTADRDNSHNIVITTDNALLTNWYSTSGSPSTSITLNKNKLNIIQVDAGCTLSINNASNIDAALTILSAKLIKTPSGNEGGINNTLLCLPPAQVTSFVNSYIKNHLDFFATVDIPNTMLLDVKKMTDPKVWFEYNNQCNKFVMAELDTTSFTNIEIASSSRVK